MTKSTKDYNLELSKLKSSMSDKILKVNKKYETIVSATDEYVDIIEPRKNYLYLNKINKLGKLFKEYNHEANIFIKGELNLKNIIEKENKIIEILAEIIGMFFNIDSDKINYNYDEGTVNFDNLKIDIKNKKYSILIKEGNGKSEKNLYNYKNKEVQNEYEDMIEFLDEFGYTRA